MLSDFVKVAIRGLSYFYYEWPRPGFSTEVVVIVLQIVPNRTVQRQRNLKCKMMKIILVNDRRQLRLRMSSWWLENYKRRHSNTPYLTLDVVFRAINDQLLYPRQQWTTFCTCILSRLNPFPTMKTTLATIMPMASRSCPQRSVVCSPCWIVSRFWSKM